MILHFVILGVVLFASGVLCAIPYSHAHINVKSVHPASGSRYMYVEDAGTDTVFGYTYPQNTFFLNAHYNYIDQPLVKQTATGLNLPLIEQLHAVELRPGWIIAPNFSLSYHISINSLRTPHNETENCFSDSSFQLKYRLTDNDNSLPAVIIPELYIPTGDKNLLLSSGQMGAALKMSLEKNFSRFFTSLNLGYRYLPKSIWRDMDYERHFILGAGVRAALNSALAVTAEALGYISTPFKEASSPGEYFMGVQWQISPATQLSAGVSLGGLDNTKVLNESLRSIIGIKIFPDPETNALPATKCDLKTSSHTLYIRAPRPEEMMHFKDLPYRSKSSNPLKTMMLGEMTGLAVGGIPFVRNSHVLFAIDLHRLPPARELYAVDQAQLKLHVNKISQDSYLSTEILCLQREKVCSGTLFEEKSWKDDINPMFFTQNASTANTYFSSLYLQNPVGTWGGRNVYSHQLTLPLQELFKNSNLEVRDILYSPTSPAPDTIYFSVADDTFIHSDGRLEIILTTEVCT